MAGLRPKVQIEKSMDKKTICIFTIHAYNYGAVLQACALRLFCEKTIRDSDVRIVGFYRECHSRIFRRQSERPLINLALNVLSAFRYGALKRRLRRESRFIRKYGKLSVHYDSPEALLKNPPPADCYITGSDQVFNSNSVLSATVLFGISNGMFRPEDRLCPEFRIQCLFRRVYCRNIRLSERFFRVELPGNQRRRTFVAYIGADCSDGRRSYNAVGPGRMGRHGGGPGIQPEIYSGLRSERGRAADSNG